jgi:hypothetical protein
LDDDGQLRTGFSGKADQWRVKMFENKQHKYLNGLAQTRETCCLTKNMSLFSVMTWPIDGEIHIE